jgi:hypothetical protein
MPGGTTSEGSDEPPPRVQALVRALDRSTGSSLATAAALARSPSAAVRTAGYVARLPSVRIQVSDEPSGRVIRDMLGARMLGLVPSGRLAQAVFSLDGSVEAQLNGPHRQALRTNLRRGHELGLAVHLVSDARTLTGLIAAVGRRRGERVLGAGDTPPEVDPAVHRGYVVTDPLGVPEGYLLLAVDRYAAWMLRSIGSRPGGSAALCHYLLHAAAVRDLTYLKVRHLIADGALSVPDGVAYLQRRLGYQIRNVELG